MCARRRATARGPGAVETDGWLLRVSAIGARSRRRSNQTGLNAFSIDYQGRRWFSVAAPVLSNT